LRIGSCWEESFEKQGKTGRLKMIPKIAPGSQEFPIPTIPPKKLQQPINPKVNRKTHQKKKTWNFIFQINCITSEFSRIFEKKL
jgi:2-keto-4-pentenoate hydratase/2-oxohepta-3-ene-1,7-dioic acid hydratase in catechol pathway